MLRREVSIKQYAEKAGIDLDSLTVYDHEELERKVSAHISGWINDNSEINDRFLVSRAGAVNQDGNLVILKNRYVEEVKFAIYDTENKIVQVLPLVAVLDFGSYEELVKNFFEV